MKIKSSHRCLDFSYNWNSKLDNKIFSTIRQASNFNLLTFQSRSTVKIFLKGAFLFEAKILDVKIDFINNFPKYAVMLVTGYDYYISINILKKMYSKYIIDIHSVKFMYILLQKI